MPSSQLETVAEAVTVTGALPVVDAHGLSRELALSGDVIRSLPTARSYNALLVLLPGVATTSNDVVTGTATTSFPVHGGRINEGRLTLDGLNIGSPPSGNSATSYVVDTGTAEEVTFRTATALGETETSGLVMNIVGRSGGNTFRGSLFASGTGDALQSDNLTPALINQGRDRGNSADRRLRCRGRARRTDCQRSRVVFRQRARGRQHEGERERFLQSERGRLVAVALLARSQTPGILRSDIRECQRPPHLADQRATQGQRLLGCTAAMPRLHRGHARPCRAATNIARGRGRAGTAAACRAGGVVVPTDGSTPRRRSASAPRPLASATSNGSRIPRGG